MMQATRFADAIAQPHATLCKFGFPGNLVHLGEHWALLVRPAQPTLGSLVLCAIADVKHYGELPTAAFVEQAQLVQRIETLLGDICQFEKLNYLMLMMVDPHVHFHVIPRYSGQREFGGDNFTDYGWPGLPDLGRNNAANPALIDAIKAGWSKIL